jgi:diadenylate cyclase
MITFSELLNLIHGLLLSLRQTVSFWDLVDILIVALLIYRILSFMRKTSASSVIKGIALILLAAWLSNLLHMNVLSFLLAQVLQLGIIVIVVLFQPELRKLFEQMGASRLIFFFRNRGGFENVETGINKVVAASEEMLKNETGALIIFERDIGLNDYVLTGTRIDAHMTSELLQNIFYHNSPLHDGAVIVRDGRLLAAACMLPLSNNVNLSRDLGMRHRAGVGISERSDAVAVIVSEQSGTVSVAIDGMLKRHLTKDTFDILLRNELVLTGNTRKKNKKSGKPNAQKSNNQKHHVQKPHSPKEGNEK